MVADARVYEREQEKDGDDEVYVFRFFFTPISVSAILPPSPPPNVHNAIKFFSQICSLSVS